MVSRVAVVALEGGVGEDQEVELGDLALDLDEEIHMSGLRLAVKEVEGELNSSLVPISRTTLGPVLKVLY